ncbi:MAG: hypothetical protein ACRDNS_02290 [Trebonia sp.]
MSPPPAPLADPRMIPDSPPDDVLYEIGVAARVYDRLLASGRELRFDTDPVTGRLSARLMGVGGETLTKLSATDVIDLAAGEQLG